MPAESYTPDPALVELVARALAAEDVHWGYDHGFWVTDKETDPETDAFARAVLAALATEGRLLDADAEMEEEWGVRWRDPRPASYFPEISSDYGSEEKAREFAEAYGEPHGVVVHRRHRVGPWLPAPTETEITEETP